MKSMRMLVLILCTCFVSVAWGQQPAVTVLPDWLQFHRATMNRWNSFENVINVNNVGNLGLKWSHATGSFVYSSPATANGVVNGEVTFPLD